MHIEIKVIHFFILPNKDYVATNSKYRALFIGNL